MTFLFWGKTFEKHDECLKATLSRARESNLKFKLEKCPFRKKGVLFFGHRLTHKGVKPELLKIEAIINMPQPEDKKEIQRLLCMVNYVRKFVPNLSEITSSLRQLLKEDIAWHWTERHSRAFEEIKTLLSSAQPGILAYNNVMKSVYLQIDSS